MKKTVFTALAVLAFSSSAMAQLSFDFGVKGGLNTSSLSNNPEDSDFNPSFHVGGFVEFNVTDKFSIQPELIYSNQGSKSSVEAFGIKSSNKTTNGYVNLPLLLKYYPVSSVAIEVGPQVGFLVASTNSTQVGELDPVEIDTKESYNTTDVSLAFGASYDVTTNLFVGVRYTMGLTDVKSSDITEILSNNKTSKNGVAQASIGYRF